MSISAQLRSEDWREIFTLTGECRELGDEQSRWRRHLLERLRPKVGFDLGFFVEMAGCGTNQVRDLGYTDLGYEDGFNRANQTELYVRIKEDPSIYEGLNTYFDLLRRDDGVSLSAKDLPLEKPWYASKTYNLVHRPLGVDHGLFCYKLIPSDPGDAFSGMMLNRAPGGRDFSGRNRRFVAELQANLVPMLGGPLARFEEPSPLALTPQAQKVLGCLLEGDGDKQIAARMGLKRLTVNQYTKQIYLHFQVNSRSELLARWVRRGWGNGYPWRP